MYFVLSFFHEFIYKACFHTLQTHLNKVVLKDFLFLYKSIPSYFYEYVAYLLCLFGIFQNLF